METSPPTSTPAKATFSYRDDPAVPRFLDDKPIIIFDGRCALCSGFVQFVLKRDPQGQFRFIPAQSDLGAALYKHFELNPIEFQTNILLEQGCAWFRSEGSIRMFEKLGTPWSLMAIGRLLPLRCRDILYEYIARNRLRWFGKRTQCFLPSREFEARFLS